MSQKPSIGRIVHYHEQVGDKVVCRAAIITEVMSPKMTLEGLNESRAEISIFGVRSLRHKSEVNFSETAKPGCWTWPHIEKERVSAESESKEVQAQKVEIQGNHREDRSQRGR